MAPLYGQVVAGPPGAGKTTYCTGMQEYLRLLGRKAWVINLDPANEVPKKRPLPNDSEENSKDDNAESGGLPYDCLLDVCESVVNLSSVMKQLGLGPNGGLVYCMEYLEAHVEEVVEMIRERVEEDAYLIFDLPGQVELYTNGTSVPRLLQELVRVLDLRLVAIQMIDSHYCTEPATFLSAALLGTTTMLRLELPTVSILSKIDLLANYGPLPFSLDFFTECQDLERLLPFLQGGSGNDNQDDDHGDNFDCGDDFTEDKDYQKARRRTRSSPFFRKHEKLHRVLAEVIEDFGLLSFIPLDISSAESVGRVVARIDKCNGYMFVASQKSDEAKAQDLFEVAVRADPSNYETIADIQERLSDAREYKREQEAKT
jgi:GTPase SAR1 family protein